MNKGRFVESLNFSQKKEDDRAIKIKKWGDINFYQTLILYCENNNINIVNILEPEGYGEFDEAVEIMSIFGQSDKLNDYYYFWID